METATSTSGAANPTGAPSVSSTVDLTLGISNSRGVYFSGTVDDQGRAAYAFRETPGGSIRSIVGEPDQVKAQFMEDKHREAFHGGADDDDLKDVYIPILVGIGLVVLMAWLGGQLSYTLGMLAFVLVGYFPFETFLVVARDCGTDSEEFQQFRRNHGAEHTVANHYRKNRKNADADWTLASVSQASYIDRECGTIWNGSLFIFAIVLGVDIAFGPAWGLVPALQVLGATLVLLLLNLYLNPANPLKLIQMVEVARPTDYELETALAAYQALASSGPAAAPAPAAARAPAVPCDDYEAIHIS